jgi:methionine synthase II (cobalamin-independent)
MTGIKGLATGIGSLPYKDAEPALDLIFKSLPEIPFWPQLPKRNSREGMIAQFAENFPCLKVTADGLLADFRKRDQELELFYGRIIAEDLDYFRISRNAACGLYGFYERLKKSELKKIDFIKCQVSGPFTFAASINDDSGRPLLHDEVLMQAILKGLQMKALWQIKVFKEFGKKIIFFFDEPYLAGFGSAFTPIDRQTLIKGLNEFSSGIKSQGVLVGVHCCGNTDWSIFTQLQNLDIISFDAFNFLDKICLYAEELKKFFQRGGILCWGIVPTQEFSDKINQDLLIKKIKSGIDALAKKGLDKDLLRDNLLVSPACGLGMLDAAKAENIFRLLAELSASIKKF